MQQLELESEKVCTEPSPLTVEDCQGSTHPPAVPSPYVSASAFDVSKNITLVPPF